MWRSDRLQNHQLWLNNARNTYRDRRRRAFGEHTEHESSVQLTELFDGDRVPFTKLCEFCATNVTMSFGHIQCLDNPIYRQIHKHLGIG